MFKKSVYENMKKSPQRVGNSNWIIFLYCPELPNMAQNWKSISEIGLRHPLLYLLCIFFSERQEFHKCNISHQGNFALNKCQYLSLFYFFCIPYSPKQKHVLLFRKKEILLLKVLITNMPQNFFLGAKLFCLSR